MSISLEELLQRRPLSSSEVLWISYQLTSITAESHSSHISLSIDSIRISPLLHISVLHNQWPPLFTLDFSRCTLPPEAIRLLISKDLPLIKSNLCVLTYVKAFQDAGPLYAFSLGCILAELYQCRPLYTLQQAVEESKRNIAEGVSRPICDITNVIKGLTSVNPSQRMTALSAKHHLEELFPELINLTKCMIAIHSSADDESRWSTSLTQLQCISASFLSKHPRNNTNLSMDIIVRSLCLLLLNSINSDSISIHFLFALECTQYKSSVCEVLSCFIMLLSSSSPVVYIATMQTLIKYICANPVVRSYEVIHHIFPCLSNLAGNNSIYLNIHLSETSLYLCALLIDILNTDFDSVRNVRIFAADVFMKLLYINHSDIRLAFIKSWSSSAPIFTEDQLHCILRVHEVNLFYDQSQFYQTELRISLLDLAKVMTTSNESIKDIITKYLKWAILDIDEISLMSTLTCVYHFIQLSVYSWKMIKALLRTFDFLLFHPSFNLRSITVRICASFISINNSTCSASSHSMKAYLCSRSQGNADEPSIWSQDSISQMFGNPITKETLNSIILNFDLRSVYDATNVDYSEIVDDYWESSSNEKRIAAIYGISDLGASPAAHFAAHEFMAAVQVKTNLLRLRDTPMAGYFVV